MNSYLSEEELNYYIHQNEKYYLKTYNCEYSFHVGDVVIISKNLTHDKGYQNQIGIVESWSGIDNYVYVVAYDINAKRYWACGFSELDLTKVNTRIDYVHQDLKSAYYKWIKSNGNKFLPEENFQANITNNKKDLVDLTLTKEEYDAIPILISMSQIYLWDLYNKKEDDKFYKQHKENMDLIKQYHDMGYQGIMANANEILNKIISK